MSLDRQVVAGLTSLDTVLRDRVARFRAGAPPEPDGMGAYYVPDAEVDALLDALAEVEPPRPTLHDARVVQGETGLDRLAGFGLSAVEVDAILICLAPELDRRYERIYGYLHDDISRRAPSVGLILDLSCANATARLAGRACFGPAGPLLRQHLLSVEGDGPLLERAVRLSPRVVRFLLEGDRPDDVDDRLTSVVRAMPAASAPDRPAGFEAVLDGVERLYAAGSALALDCGPNDGPGRDLAAALAGRLGARLLLVRATALAALPAEQLGHRLALIVREARLHPSVTFWSDVDALTAREASALQLTDALVELAAVGPAFLAGADCWRPGPATGLTVLPLGLAGPDLAERSRLWAVALAGADPSMVDGVAPRLATTFRFGGVQIRAAAAAAALAARAQGRSGGPDEGMLFAAAREQSDGALARLAQRVPARHRWADLVLPAARVDQLREIADQVRYRDLVHDEWGFGGPVAAAPGLNVLFAGPPGTGKTMAASVLAGELGVELYKIDLSSMVSKYIGETEKNLARVFDEAATSDAILFFDEADALFGKRTSVRDAHDRYANLETSYLLQKLESHAGVIVLATNLRKNMDEAFVRRLHATVDFPAPELAERTRIWQQIWPAEAPLGPDVDLERLARQVDLPGGHIRNIALAAAFLAAADGGKITMDHLLRAARAEYQKLGKVITTPTLSP